MNRLVKNGKDSMCQGDNATGRRGRGRGPGYYFFGNTPVWLVPPQKTFVPTRSRRPEPLQARQGRYEPLKTPPKCLPVMLQVGHFLSG